MAIGDIYQVKLVQNQSAQIFNNVFYFIASVGITSAVDLADAFIADYIPKIRAIQSGAVITKQLVVINGMANGDQRVDDMSLAGTRAGTSLASFLAAGFRKRTGGIGTRYSYKRFAASVTSDFAGQGLWISTYLDLLDALAVQLGQVLEGVNGAYSPLQVVGGFQLGVVPQAGQFLTGNWQINEKVTHQDTRQEYQWINATP